jgi:DNA repair protein RadC
MKAKISTAAEAAAVLRAGIPRRLFKTQECFAVLALDSAHRPLGRPVLVAVGTAGGVSVHPRDVFRAAVRKNAVAIIVAHNHPSGDPEPSQEDRDLTARLTDAGDLLRIAVLDHILLAGDRWASLADRGLV